MKVNKSGIIFGFIFVFAWLISCERNTQLTSKQKVKDFEFLYQTLEENYPYFGAEKRKTGLDWLAKHNEYVEQIKATKTDSAYIFTLQSILHDLGNPHTNLYINGIWEYAVNVFKTIPANVSTQEKTRLTKKGEKYLTVLENPQARPIYWRELMEKQQQPNLNQPDEFVPPSNYTDSIIARDKIGIIRISSFDSSNIERDSAFIVPFLDKIKDFDYLIIDIQNNGGGSGRYWEKNIVGNLIQDTIRYPAYSAGKNGSLNRYFFPDYFDSIYVAKEDDKLQNIPVELSDGTFHISTSMRTLSPNNVMAFRGKIYLLVNSGVFSAAEWFVIFCKTTKWATVAGTTTGGDGGGPDPIPFMLPESGMFVWFQSIAGLNVDGSFNFETKTIPDITIEGNADERLQKLIDYIQESKSIISIK
jgi:hypothetical protein